MDKKIKNALIVLVLLLVAAGAFWLGGRFSHKEQFEPWPRDYPNNFFVELPEGIDDEDIGNLNNDQKQSLDREVDAYLESKIAEYKWNEDNMLPLIVVLTKNGKPILPDLNAPGVAPGTAPGIGPGNLPPGTQGPGADATQLPDQMPGPADGSASDDAGDNDTPAPTTENELNFEFEKRPDLGFSIGQIYHDAHGGSIQDDVGEIYGELRGIMGPPSANNTVTIGLTEGDYPCYYNPTTNEIKIDPRRYSKENYVRYDLTKLIIFAFYDDYLMKLPKNWEMGLVYVALQAAYQKLYDPDFQFAPSDKSAMYELFKLSPAFATLNGYYLLDEFYMNPNATFHTVSAVKKLYLEDKSFIANLNQEIYKADPDQIKKDITKLAAKVKPKAEDTPFENWISENYFLQVEHHPGKHVMPVFTGKRPEIKVVEMTEDGARRKGLNGLNVNVKAYDIDENMVFSKAGQTAATYSGNGIYEINSYFPRLSSGYTGPVRFDIDATKANMSLYYPYRDGRALIGNEGDDLGIFGCVTNRKTGTMNVLTPGLNAARALDNGLFVFPEFKDYEGPVELVFYDNERGDTEGTRIKFTKLYGDYYFNFRMMGVAAAATDLPNVFTSEKFKFRINYPNGYEVYDPTQGPEPHEANPDYKGPQISSSAVQFIKEDPEAKNMIGAQVVNILWHLKEKEQPLSDFAKAYMMADGPTSVTHKTIGGHDVLVFSYKTQMMEEPGAPGQSGFRVSNKETEVRQYFIERGKDIFIFSTTDEELMLKMMETLKFF